MFDFWYVSFSCFLRSFFAFGTIGEVGNSSKFDSCWYIARLSVCAGMLKTSENAHKIFKSIHGRERTPRIHYLLTQCDSTHNYCRGASEREGEEGRQEIKSSVEPYARARVEQKTKFELKNCKRTEARNDLWESFFFCWAARPFPPPFFFLLLLSSGIILYMRTFFDRHSTLCCCCLAM